MNLVRRRRNHRVTSKPCTSATNSIAGCSRRRRARTHEGELSPLRPPSKSRDASRVQKLVFQSAASIKNLPFCVSLLRNNRLQDEIRY